MQQHPLRFEGPQVLSVSQLVHQVRSKLETGFHDLWIQGEISNLRRPGSGHLYFTLKDEDAQIAAVCFRLQALYLKFAPEDGMDVLARGSLSVYPPRGQLQMIVEYMEPLGRGALQLAFEQLKAKLAREGLFDASRKKPLPLLPSRIAVVTSPAGAALQDILRILKRRNDRVDVLIYPVRVQGQGAAREIAAGIDYLNRRHDVDVIILARGGGSLEDLWAFNEEAVARAIFRSRIPVISAVGHEVDFTIADFVADLRAPTPSAAAEIVCGVREELIEHINHLLRRAVQAIRLILNEKKQAWHKWASSRAFVDAETRLRLYSQRLDELTLRLQRTLPAWIEPLRIRSEQAARDLVRAVKEATQARSRRLDFLTSRLQAFSPLAVLERGYAIVSNQAGEIVRDPAQVSTGELVKVRVARGDFQARRED